MVDTVETRKIFPICRWEWILVSYNEQDDKGSFFTLPYRKQETNTTCCMWDAAGCMSNPRVIKGSQGLHLEASLQSHGKGEDVKDFSFLMYMNLVWKLFVKCRNCCLVVRSFQTAALQALCVCPLSVGEYLRNHLSFLLVPASFERKKGGRRAQNSWNFLESHCFQREDPKEAIQEELLGLQ